MITNTGPRTPAQLISGTPVVSVTGIVAVLLPDVVDDCVAEYSDDVVVTRVTVVVTVPEVVIDDVAVVVADVVDTVVVVDEAVVVLEAAVTARGQVPAWMLHSPTVITAAEPVVRAR